MKKKAYQVDGHEFSQNVKRINEDRPSICTDMARDALGLRPPKRYMGSLKEGSGLMSRCRRLGHSVAVMGCFESETTRGTRVNMEKKTLGSGEGRQPPKGNGVG